MAAKPPRGGKTHVEADVHVSPNRQSQGDSTHPDGVNQNGFDPWTLKVDSATRPSAVNEIDLDAILPAAVVTVQQTSMAYQTRPSTQPLLEHYLIDAQIKLPHADSDGFRVYNKRLYVDLSDGGIVLVALDARTGLYRARRANELQPSGPELQRNPVTGLWHARNDAAPDTAPLTETRLQAFRTELDFSSAEADSDGLYRHDGKRYAVIFNHAYQALHDLDASTPSNKVWRIVKPTDPVASDSANLYRASRSGESLAITRNEDNAWISIFVGLRGGMRRHEPGPGNPGNLHRPWLDTTPGPSGRHAPAVVGTTRAQVKRYFPEATDQHADDFIARFGAADAAEMELERLRLGLPELIRELSAWEAAYKGGDSEERIRRLAICDTLHRLYKWQGDASERVYRDGQLVGFKLELDLGNRANLQPPILSTRVESIVSLSLKGTAVQKLDALFSRFSHVEALEVRNLAGTGKELFAAMNRFTELKLLEIHQCTLFPPTPEGTNFSELPHLRELTLIDCQVHFSISVRGLTELRVLRVRGSNMQFPPAGLTDRPGPSRLEVLDLSTNPYLESLPDLTTLLFLRELDLSFNTQDARLVGLDANVWRERLEILRLENTRLTGELSLRGMTGLRELNLAGMGLTRLPDSLRTQDGPMRLEILNLARNRLDDAPSLRGRIALRELDLANTGITQLPEGLGTENGPLRLEILNLSANPLFVAPSFRGMTALREVDLRETHIDSFPQGVTSEIPQTSLNLADNFISSIPESLELRKGFNLAGNPLLDAASQRRFIAARHQTGSDIWLGKMDPDTSANLWLHNVPEADRREKLELWSALGADTNPVIRRLSMTPEFRIERQQLQRRVWAMLEGFSRAEPDEKSQLRAIMRSEPCPGKMLDRLEEVIKKFDPTRQNQPAHHLSKRPGFD